MPRQETILTVFVASPSDVEEERNRLEEVIRELNIAWSRDLKIRLELVRWETHAYPGFGADAQAVINEQIPDDYDLFIGIMWYRFGTPTGRALSGTLEEFQLAKKRFDADSSKLHLMIYFKDEPIPLPPSKIDYAQLAQVSQFRSGLGAEGGLYWSFTSTTDFEQKVRLHLIRQVQSLRVKQTTEIAQQDTTTPFTRELDRATVIPVDEDDIGLLDLIDQCEDEFGTLEEIMERITAAALEMAEKMKQRTIEMQEFKRGAAATDRKAAKRLIARAAGDMDQFVHRMEAELPLFSQHQNAGMNALVRAASMSVEFKFDGEALQQVQDNLRDVRSLCESLENAEDQIIALQEIVAATPRMTTVLNRAKRAMINVLQQLSHEYRSVQTMAPEAEASFALILADAPT